MRRPTATASTATTSTHRRAGKTRLLTDERGLSTVEYIILLCLIAVTGLAIWARFGRTVEGHARAAEAHVVRLPTTSSL